MFHREFKERCICRTLYPEQMEILTVFRTYL
jgi:hypothetical protein